MIKPPKLNPGDKVATVSLSWGGPSAFPHRYRAGVRQLENEFGLTVVEMPHTLKDAGWLARNPEARAADGSAHRGLDRGIADRRAFDAESK